MRSIRDDYMKQMWCDRNLGMVQCRATIYACMILIILLWVPALGLTTGDPDFNYNLKSAPASGYSVVHSDESQLCQQGQRQSPIAINISNSTINETLGRLNFTYVPSVGVLSNTGHSAQVSFQHGVGSFMVGDEVYHLKQFHFHTPSEHVIEDVRFPLEMHLVHQSSTGRIAVIGVVFSTGGCNHNNRFLNQFWNALPNITEKSTKITIGQVNFDYLYIGPFYARYEGSLTTPPCSEDVTWTIGLSKWNVVSQSELVTLMEAFPEKDARPLQEINGRIIELYPTKPQANMDALLVC